MKKICVVGSLNVDLTIRLPRFHMPGETIIADTLNTYPGGKGGNQAVAAAKLGAQVMMAGMLGEDGSGRLYRRVLSDNGIDASCVGSDENTPSGTALIEVDAQGENRIAIVPGTNGLVNNAYIDSILDKILHNDLFMMQFEIAIDTVCYLAQILRAHGKTVILDPAPAMQAPDALYASVDIITPNSTELSILSGMNVDTDAHVISAARSLLSRGAKAVVAKLGARGCLYVDAKDAYPVRGYRVHVVDTTAAGDSFNAGLTVAIAQGMQMKEALAFANAVGALSTMGPGAQGSMPQMADVRTFIAQNEAQA